MDLALDIDGVLADFDRGWVEAHTATCSCGLTPGTPQLYGDDTLTLLSHQPSSVYFWYWFRMCVGYDNLPPVPGAVEGLRRLADAHSILLVTSRPAVDAPATRRWVLGTWPEINLPIVHTSAKWLVDCELWIDDNPDTIGSVREWHNSDQRAVCFAQPWNSHVAPPRVETWSELLRFVGRWEG